MGPNNVLSVNTTVMIKGVLLRPGGSPVFSKDLNNDTEGLYDIDSGKHYWLRPELLAQSRLSTFFDLKI